MSLQNHDILHEIKSERERESPKSQSREKKINGVESK